MTNKFKYSIANYTVFNNMYDNLNKYLIPDISNLIMGYTRHNNMDKCIEQLKCIIRDSKRMKYEAEYTYRFWDVASITNISEMRYINSFTYINSFLLTWLFRYKRKSI